MICSETLFYEQSHVFSLLIASNKSFLSAPKIICSAIQLLMSHELESTVDRNINTLRYAEDTTLTAESEEELKSL